MTATDNLAALLREILANPDDDTVRLAYADALQERGEPWDAERAEFIRLSMHPLIENRNRKQFRRMRQLGYYLYPEFDVWYGERDRQMLTYDGLSLLGPSPSIRVLFFRGFISEVACPAEDWITNADRILSQHPVREVTLSTWPTTPYQDANHIWLTGRDRLKKFQIGKLGDDTRELILKGYWPEIKFTLPPWTVPT